MHQMFVFDVWRSASWSKNIFLSKAITEVYCKRNTKVNTRKPNFKNTNIITIRLREPLIDPAHTIAVVGNTSYLGGWTKPILMQDDQYPVWQVHIPFEGQEASFQYKFVKINKTTGEIIAWEGDANRWHHTYLPTPYNNELILNEEWFRSGLDTWKAADLAIPVFSIRTHAGFGIGEFTDLHSLIDLSATMGMKVLQTLPINDTLATKTWTDSYPYAAISVFALHPLYINMEQISPWSSAEDKAQYEAIRSELNDLPSVDFEKVLKFKMHFFKVKFYETFSDIRETKAYRDFIRQNREWIYAYAAFCHLRDLYGSPNFNQWPKFSKYNYQEIEQFFNPSHEKYTDVHFYIWLQYHAHHQLIGAKAYGRTKGVILKGDLPIGIFRHSADAWVAPELYNMSEQAGAPPDDYAVDGQNWGFPTYNWQKMAEDNFSWWQKRMQKLEEYFDALRIDHILGFFRIWQIPIDQVSGVLGLFNPRLPYTLEDLSRMGLRGDVRRYSKPYIRHHMLEDRFGSESHNVISEYMDEAFEGAYQFKEAYDTQLKIHQDSEIPSYLKDKLMGLVSEVLLIEEPNSHGTAFNPRITLHKTQSFQELSNDEKRVFEALYQDYFYHRHEQFWKEQALWKLPKILSATNMLICAEDLGMIPSTVSEVMNQLHLLSLEIQRMPKGPEMFGIPEKYPYLSVCSPSCHDMSTIRGWWEENPDLAQLFYEHRLHRIGKAPDTCSEDIVSQIILQHLYAPSVLSIFPIQDILGMYDSLKRPIAKEEQINQPANPKHYWRYRLHLPIEDLLATNYLTQQTRHMVVQSKRVMIK